MNTLLTPEQMSTMTEVELSKYNESITSHILEITDAMFLARMRDTTILSELVKTTNEMDIKVFSDALNAELHCRKDNILNITTRSSPRSPNISRADIYMKRIGFHFMTNTIRDIFRININLISGETISFDVKESKRHMHALDVKRVED